jgi:hypothetical protein
VGRVDWIRQAGDRVHWLDVVNTVVNLRIPRGLVSMEFCEITTLITNYRYYYCYYSIWLRTRTGGGLV